MICRPNNYFVVSIFVFVALACGPDLIAQDSCAAVLGECADDRRVVETPSGFIDGRNHAFTLSRPPASNSKVLLFKTGLRLTEGVDYQVNARDIMTIGPAIPQPGDTLTAVYTPALHNVSGEPETPTPVFDAGSGADIADVALREALRLELTQRAVVSPGSQELTMILSGRLRELRPNEDAELTSNDIDGGSDPVLRDINSNSAVPRSKALEMLHARLAAEAQSKPAAINAKKTGSR